MSYYEKTIRTVTEVKSLTSHMTSLGRLMALSEDGHLCYLIASVVQGLRYQYEHSTAKATPTSLMFFPMQQTIQLVEYCKYQTRMKKPEWQVLAEQNGWTPPQLSSKV